MNPSYELLALCASTQCTDSQYAQIARQAAVLQDWNAIPRLAEQHGLAPLLYTHLKAAGIHPPSNVWRNIHALYLRHCLASQARERTLVEITVAFANAGIQMLVLKGAALAYVLYDDPALRPMRDVDLLVSRADVVRAQQVLGKLGFSAPVPSAEALPDRHTGAARDVDGFMITVEVHHNLFSTQDTPLSMTIGDMLSAPLPFVLGETAQVAHTLGYEDMLWHLCQHTRLSSGVFGENRLIWVADIVGFAERYVQGVDWALVRAHYPLVLRTLSLFHFLTPLSETLLNTASIELGAAPDSIGADFVGWPRFSIAQQRHKGMLAIIRDTCWPSEWWLRLHYGLGSADGVFGVRYFHHLLHILGWVWHLLRERVRAIIGRWKTKDEE
jgi:hypothetical protein